MLLCGLSGKSPVNEVFVTTRPSKADDPTSKPKKVAILGTTPSRLEAPIGDPDWEIWTIGPGGKDAHRWDRLYETHTVWPEDFTGYLNDLSLVKPPQQVRTLTPMVTRVRDWALRQHGKDEAWLASNVKGAWAANQVIDREDLFRRYQRRLWFSTSIAYAVAEAIDEGFTHIGCWGIDLESDEEHIAQFIGVAHLLDIAKMRGIITVFPAGCGLERDLNPYPDRYETILALTYEKKAKWLDQLIAQTRAEAEQKHAHAQRIEGALLKLRELNAGQQMLAEGEQEFIRMQQECDAIKARFHHLEGERSAVAYFQRMFTWGMFDPNKML